MRIELVGGPHCGAVAEVAPERQPVIWTGPCPRQNAGSAYQVSYTNGPATTDDAVYRLREGWNGEGRYVYCGQYEVA